uniref:Uncharacterized protein n=1 Tax=Heterorhabditis bacteriophora TaxID=37862 RepID=A0A1I7WQU5_HETBA
MSAFLRNYMYIVMIFCRRILVLNYI